MRKALCLTLGLLSLLLPSQALAQISVIPSNLDNRGFYLEIKAGETASTNILVTNLAKEPASIQMYAVDSSQTEEGAFSFTTKNHEQKSLGLWTQTPENKINLGARETKSIEFTISIPEQAPPGAYIGGIAVEEIAGENDSQIQINSRVVSKVVVRVPGKLVHKYNFSGFHENDANFIIDLKNEGSSLLTSKGQINIQGWPQKHNQSLNYKELQTPPGQNSSVKIPWPQKPWFGIYEASANLQIGQYDFLKRNTVDKEIVIHKIQIVILPWELLAAAIILLFSIIGSLFFLKLRIQKIKKNCAPYIVKKGEDINQIAAKHKIKWQLLAKINKMEAPYKLESGQKILVPKI